MLFGEIRSVVDIVVLAHKVSKPVNSIPTASRRMIVVVVTVKFTVVRVDPEQKHPPVKRSPSNSGLGKMLAFYENHFMIDSKIPSSPIMMGLRVSSYIHAFFIRIIRIFEPWMIRKFCVESYPYPPLCAYNT